MAIHHFQTFVALSEHIRFETIYELLRTNRYIAVLTQRRTATIVVVRLTVEDSVMTVGMMNMCSLARISN